ncbi:hypothetical protein GOBAR_AA35303 [Gossypium barbadense]|uniref:Uncharacterized protein n=1 Tax=Gossypium barbadense TaxID=3634 RepID=A0A2P5W2R1_GOSBA|nr:hypothetical protein GOBAR_AA35303 [Gossypium barbadense]
MGFHPQILCWHKHPSESSPILSTGSKALRDQAQFRPLAQLCWHKHPSESSPILSTGSKALRDQAQFRPLAQRPFGTKSGYDTDPD